jgi:rhamnulokinase
MIASRGRAFAFILTDFAGHIAQLDILAAMSGNNVFLAVDMGASSGRHVAGLFDGELLTLEEVHRFENGPVAVGDHLHWDLLHQWDNIQQGLRAAAAKYGDRIRSIGVDTWGVDFGLLGRGDELIGNPYHYRDARTEGMIDRATTIVPREEIFAQSGLQFMRFNTLYQLLAMRLARSPLLEAAESLLMMPDLFHWLLTGVKANEFTEATTTQFFDPRREAWAIDLLARFELPAQILGDVIQPGTTLGPLRPTVAEATGLTNVKVVAPGTHDTASAVMAVPAVSKPDARGRVSPRHDPQAGAPRVFAPANLRSERLAHVSEPPDWCYISSGTWSLMGVETAEPIVNEKCLALNFTNEGGVGGTTRVLKNICGLWMVQECRRRWNQGGVSYSWDHLAREAAAAPPLVSLVDVDDDRFAAPGDMPEAIRAYCRRTGQPVPDGVGAVIRCALESLALKYRQVLAWLEELVGGRIETIHIVGGGTQNRQLCQMAADACRRRVVAGPIEATAIGNVMMQAVSAGVVGSIAEAREVIRRSFSVEEYHPQDPDPWDAAQERYRRLIGI